MISYDPAVLHAVNVNHQVDFKSREQNPNKVDFCLFLGLAFMT